MSISTLWQGLSASSRLCATCQPIVSSSFDLRICIQRRTATKRGGGSTRNGRDSAGRRLGLKKSGGQAVVPGNIILRQRGFTWHPGQHVGVGKDHTLYALAPGWVQFYNAPKLGSANHTKRKHCGIVLEQGDKLPRDEENLGRSRHISVVNLKEVEQGLETIRELQQSSRSLS